MTECECDCDERIDELKSRIDFVEFLDGDQYVDSKGYLYYEKYIEQFPSPYPFNSEYLKKADKSQLIFKTDDIKQINDMINCFDEYDEISSDYSVDDDGEEYKFEVARY